MQTQLWETLAQAAMEARQKSYSPYSGFQVGAAILAKSGKIYTGCNIESVSYSPTNCAERTALFKAVSEGEREFLAIAVHGGFADGRPSGDGYAVPCGVCRQALLEFCDPKEFVVLIVKSLEESFRQYRLEELIPNGFGPDRL